MFRMSVAAAALVLAACANSVEKSAEPVEITDDTSSQTVTFAVPSEVSSERIYVGDTNYVYVSDDAPWHYGVFDLNPGARVRIDLFTLDTPGNVGFKVYRVRADGSMALLGVIDGYDGWAAALLRATNGGSFVVESVGETLPAQLALFIGCTNRGGDCSPKAQPGELCATRGAKQCDDKLWCRIDQGCGFDDRGGSCERPVEICAAVFGPQVCGCDGKTYSTICNAHSVGMNVAADGACACDPFVFEKNFGEPLDVVGSWIGKVTTSEYDISSRLTLNADGSYGYDQTWDPICLRVEPFCRRASLGFASAGTWENQGFAIQLRPDANGSPDELAQSFGVESNCEGAVRLTTTELNIEKTLERDACFGMACAEGEHCELVEVQCIRAPCYPQPMCVP